jgi:hypothetical protein
MSPVMRLDAGGGTTRHCSFRSQVRRVPERIRANPGADLSEHADKLRQLTESYEPVSFRRS